MPHKLKYFITAFGAAHANNHPVEDGAYPHRPGYSYVSKLDVSPGDVMLLYCVGGYPLHDQEAPGIGVVTNVVLGGAQEVINYQYLGFDRPPALADIRSAIPEIGGKTNFGNSGNWVREIHGDSFRAVVLGRTLIWP